MDDLTRIVARCLEIHPARVVDDLSRETTEEWDSFNHLMLVSEIEKDLGIQFSMEEVESIRTFRQLREAVRSKQ